MGGGGRVGEGLRVSEEVWQEMKCVIWEKCWGATGLFSPQSLHCGAISIQRYTVGLAKEQRAGGVRGGESGGQGDGLNRSEERKISKRVRQGGHREL